MNDNQPSGASATHTAASRDQLNRLWQLLLETYIHYIENTPRGEHRASYLESARSFLRDNQITIDGQSTKDVQKSLQELAATRLPFTNH